MSQAKGQGGPRLGPAGDTTTGPISLSEITAINPSFMRLITANTHTPPVPSTSQEVQSSVNKNPEEIAKQLQINSKKIPLLSSQELIDSLKNENLQLKMQIYLMNQQHSQRGEIGDFNTDEHEKDLIADLLKKNEELRRQLDERDKKEIRDKKEEARKRKDADCQTNLDGNNIQELFRANYLMKKQQQQQRMEKEDHRPIEHHKVQQKHLQRNERRTQQPVVSQLYYPIVTLPQRSASAKQMVPDERKTLDLIYEVDGMMTTVLDQVRAAKADTY